jgi:CO/xanthine dehydrogenase Mo-binding subunit
MRRPDARAKAQGALVYAADLQVRGMLWGAFRTSPHAHAAIRSMDVQPALEVPGVVAVLTARDVREMIPSRPEGEALPLLADQEVTYAGQPVAAVAAEDRAAARAGAEAIRVQWEPRPAFVEIEREFPEWPDSERMRGDPRVVGHVRACRGDFEKACREADVVHSEVYRTSLVAHVALEPHGCLANVRGDDWYVRTTTQTPFGVRDDLADKLHLPASQIRVEGTWVGGGFGGRNEAILEPYALLLSRKTGRPVRIQLSFREEFLWDRTTLPAVFRMDSAVRDGQLTARRTRLLLDTGGSLPGRDFALGYSLGFTLGPYRVPVWELEGYALRTHRPPFGPHRAPLAPQCAFASESHIDSLARRLGEDPTEFRLRHVWREGDETPFGQRVPPFAAEEGLRRARDYIRSRRPNLPPGHGLGIAIGFWSTGTSMGGEARVRLGPEGARIIQGEREIGNGTVVAGLLRVASEALGLPVEALRVDYLDTSQAPFDSGVFGSRTAATLGYAVRKACDAIREELGRRLSPPSGPRPLAARLRWDSGRVLVEDGGDWIPLAKVLRPEEIAAGGLERWGKHYGRPSEEIDPSWVLEGSLSGYSDVVASVHVAEVSVDPQTGAVRPRHYLAIQDAGRVLDPDLYRGQVEGGVVMGLGTALTEEGLIGEDGHWQNPGLLDYRIPTMGEVPPIEIVALQGHTGSGVFGSKGIGEPPIIPVPAAIANAVADATGQRVREIPLTPERVARALGLLGRDGGEARP